MMFDLYLTDEQRLIVDSLEAIFSDLLPTSRLRNESAQGGRAEIAAWPVIANSGLFGFGIGDEPGSGQGICEQVLAARALGKFCISPLILASMLASHMAYEVGRYELSENFASGTLRACFANPLTAFGDVQLIDSEECEWVVVLAPSPQLVAKVHCQNLRQVKSIDESVDFKRARLDSAEATTAMGARASLLTAAYLVGNALATVSMAVKYASSREQFGQPIGAFQAVKHGCADMAVRASAAESQTFYAALTYATARSKSPTEVAAARLLARTAAVGNAKANIQYHGAMGFTAECDAHWYLKRALLFAALGSNSRQEETQLLAPTTI